MTTRAQLIRVAAAVAAFVSTMSLAARTAEAASAAARCDACVERRAARFLGANATLTCAAANDAATIDRLQRTLRRCLRRHACRKVGRSVSRGEIAASIARSRCADPTTPGSSVDPAFVVSPIGEAPAAVTPETGASFDDVAAHCATIGANYEGLDTPPLMALPAPPALPAWCDEDAAYRDLVASCGPPRVVVVSASSTATQPDGTPASPFASIAAALAACAGPCHVLVGPGTYVGNVQVPACTILEGGIAVGGGAVTPGAARPVIVGAVDVDGPALVARLHVRDQYGAVNADGEVLLSDTVLRGGYEAGSSAWSTVGPRICRSHLAGNYAGFGIAWQSRRLWVAGSAISACYEGLALSWGSSDLHVLDSVVYGDYVAVSTSWGSFGVLAQGNDLGGNHAVVDIHIAPDDDDVIPASFDVTVTGNRIRGGVCSTGAGDECPQACLPASNPALGILVEGNVVE